MQTTTTITTNTTIIKAKDNKLKLSVNTERNFKLNQNILCTSRLSKRHMSNISGTA